MNRGVVEGIESLKLVNSAKIIISRGVEYQNLLSVNNSKKVILFIPPFPKYLSRSYESALTITVERILQQFLFRISSNVETFSFHSKKISFTE